MVRTASSRSASSGASSNGSGPSRSSRCSSAARLLAEPRLRSSSTSCRSPAFSRPRMFARIMSSPPDPELSPAAALSSVIAFARSVTGTLRPFSLLDRFIQEVKASFGPVPVVVVTIDEQGARESANGDLGHKHLEGLIDQVLESGQHLTQATETGTAL